MAASLSKLVVEFVELWKIFRNFTAEITKITSEVEWVGSILLAALIALFVYAMVACRKNSPTWKGIIISALLGCLPFYLILCFLGFMGEERMDNEREKPKPKANTKPKPKKKPKKRDEFDYENADDYGPEYENADKYGAEYEVEK